MLSLAAVCITISRLYDRLVADLYSQLCSSCEDVSDRRQHMLVGCCDVVTSVFLTINHS